jgi:hypothetical protein
MNPLIVSAFFDIGREGWPHLARSPLTYLERFRAFGARLGAPKFVVCDPKIFDEVAPSCSYAVAAALSEMPASGYLERTRLVIHDPRFRSLFQSKQDRLHCEHIYAEYNIAVLAKFDALRMAAQQTDYSHSHYVWVDFGAIHRSENLDAPLPPFVPRARSEVVVVAGGRQRLKDLSERSLRRYVASFDVYIVTNVMIVPAERLDAFCELVIDQYRHLLDVGLTGDGQTLLDMALVANPEYFHVVEAPRRSNPWAYVDEVIAGRA